MSRYKIGPDIDLDREDVRDASGERITEKRAQQIAQDALGKARRGRPSLSGGKVHSPTVQARVSTKTHQRVEKLAKKKGIRQSDVVREAVEAYLSNSS